MIIDRVTGEVLDRLPVVRDARCNRYRITVDPVGESMTHQGAAEECDINRIVKRFVDTGMLPPGRKPGFYGDVSDLNAPSTELYERAAGTVQTAKEFVDGAKKKAAKADGQAAADKAAGGSDQAPEGAAQAPGQAKAPA